MSLTAFAAICILGCDFMLYVLFQWLLGEKYRDRARKVAARKNAVPAGSSQPYLIHSRAPQREDDFERDAA